MTMKKTKLFFALFTGLLIGACTPKTAEPVVKNEEPPVTEPVVDENLSPCPKFQDAPNKDEVETNYVLYRDFLKVKDYPKAYDLWKKVYDVAPAADGKRNTVYADGIFFMEYFMSQTQDTVQRNGYIDEIFRIYDRIQECYPEGGYIEARKAFDYYYKYPNRKTPEEIYAMFKESIETDGIKTQDFVINPFTALMVDLFQAGKIPMEEAQRYEKFIRRRIEKGLGDCKGVDCERWKIIQEYAPVRLEAFESVKGFYPCEYYLDKYYADFEADPTNCETLRSVYAFLKFGDCPEANEKFAALIAAGNKNCVEAPGTLTQGYQEYRNGNYARSIELFEQAIQEEPSAEKKGDLYMLIARIYQTHLKNFSRSRQYAFKAAEVRPNWGEPYIHIGRLYASSGPLCGPGRGWDSQVVVWPAIDMWSRAKQVDPSSAGEANKWINRYAQYMPKKEDVFLRTLSVGGTYKVGCWIQENTVIRTSD